MHNGRSFIQHFTPSVYPWVGTVFVRPTFPLGPDDFLPKIVKRNCLTGVAGDVKMEEKTTKRGKEGYFYRFGLDDTMRASLKKKKFVVIYTVHRLTVFVAPNRRNPEISHVLQKARGAEGSHVPDAKLRPSDGPPLSVELAVAEAEELAAKRKENARKRQRENRKRKEKAKEKAADPKPAAPQSSPSGEDAEDKTQKKSQGPPNREKKKPN